MTETVVTSIGAINQDTLDMNQAMFDCKAKIPQ